MFLDKVGVVWFSLGISYALFVSLTLIPYIRKFHYKNEPHLQYKFTNWSKHSCLLAIISSISGAFLILEGLVYMSLQYYNYPCILPIFYTQIFWSLFLNSFLGRLIRVSCQYRTNQLKLKTTNESQVPSPSPSDTSFLKKSGLGLKDKFNDLEFFYYFSQEGVFAKSAAGITLIFVIINIIIGATMNFEVEKGFDGCTLSVGAMFCLFVIGVYGFIFIPIGFYYVRKTKDIYGIGKSMALCTVDCLSIYTIYFIYEGVSTAEMKIIYPPRLIGHWFLAFTHLVTICIPLISKKQESKLGLSESGFHNAISNPILLDSLKNVTIQEFNSENIQFWFSYYNLMRLCYIEMIKLEGTNQKNPIFEAHLCSFMNTTPQKLQIELSKEYSKPLALVLLNNGNPGSFSCLDIIKNITGTNISDSIWKEFLDIKATFLNSDSSLEINISHTSRTPVLKHLNYLKERMYNNRIGLYLGSNIEEMYEEDRLSCDYAISIQIFDQIKNEILKLLFLNTYRHILDKSNMPIV
jgi:hypothetical protein